MNLPHEKIEKKTIGGVSNDQEYIVLYNQTMIYIYELETLKCVFKHRCAYYVRECYFIKNDSICIIISAGGYILKVDMKSFVAKKFSDIGTNFVISHAFVTSKYLVYFKEFWERRLQCIQFTQLNLETDEFKRDEIIKGRIITNPYFHTKKIRFTTYIPNKHNSKELMEYKENDEGEIINVRKEVLDDNIYNAGDVYDSNNGVYKYIYYSYIGKLEIYKNQVKVYENPNLKIYDNIHLGKHDEYIFFKEYDDKKIVGCLFNLETLTIEKKYKDYFMDIYNGVFILDEKRKLIISGYCNNKEKTENESTYIFDY